MPNHVVVMTGTDLEAIKSQVVLRVDTHASHVSFHECKTVKEIHESPDLCDAASHTIVVLPIGFKEIKLLTEGDWKPWHIITHETDGQVVLDIIQQLGLIYEFPSTWQYA